MNRTRTAWPWRAGQGVNPTFAAIDLGTNNCRLLIASPRKNGFRVVDAFSRIVRLGEGLSRTGALSPKAMDRTIEALKICADKMIDRQVKSSRCIATQACRAAENGAEFLERVKEETGLTLDIVSAEEEATLSVKGCQDLIDSAAEAVLVFDIGGGSTEFSWLEVSSARDKRLFLERKAWTSLQIGVVTIAERFEHKDLSREEYDAIADEVADRLRDVTVPTSIRRAFQNGRAHLIGTSGTVTSVAGFHLGLKQYSRRDVDGMWLSASDAVKEAETLRQMGFDARANEPCVGRERADLVVPGCAILEGILRAWPTDQIRVGDRGLREGLLIDLISQWRAEQGRPKKRN